MKATRRGVIAGALAVPAVAGVPEIAAACPNRAVLVHDPSLEAGRRLAQAYGGEVLPIEGDRIRFARAVFEKDPAFVVGVSRPADALLIEDVGREAGYRRVSEGAYGLSAMVAASGPADRGVVVGWVMAPVARKSRLASS